MLLRQLLLLLMMMVMLLLLLLFAVPLQFQQVMKCTFGAKTFIYLEETESRRKKALAAKIFLCLLMENEKIDWVFSCQKGYPNFNSQTHPLQCLTFVSFVSFSIRLPFSKKFSCTSKRLMPLGVQVQK